MRRQRTWNENLKELEKELVAALYANPAHRSAYRSGALARRAGKSELENPYRVKKKTWRRARAMGFFNAWAAGWTFADLAARLGAALSKNKGGRNA